MIPNLLSDQQQIWGFPAQGCTGTALDTGSRILRDDRRLDCGRPAIGVMVPAQQ
jgi:hypothetical protein